MINSEPTNKLGGYQNIVTGFIQPGDLVTFPWEHTRACEEAVPLVYGWPVELAEELFELKVYRKLPVAKQGDIDNSKTSISTGPTPVLRATAPGLSQAFRASHLPDSPEARKGLPVATGVIDYFPDAIVAIAEVSRVGNDQHNPGKPLHWDRSKSGDESDALMRHFVERGTFDTDGLRHTAKMAWRALALLQKELENARLASSPSVPSAK